VNADLIVKCRPEAAGTANQVRCDRLRYSFEREKLGIQLFLGVEEVTEKFERWDGWRSAVLIAAMVLGNLVGTVAL
jgi:hypothetical protein